MGRWLGELSQVHGTNSALVQKMPIHLIAPLTALPGLYTVIVHLIIVQQGCDNLTLVTTSLLSSHKFVITLLDYQMD